VEVERKCVYLDACCDDVSGGGQLTFCAKAERRVPWLGDLASVKLRCIYFDWRPMSTNSIILRFLTTTATI
jgi:hypothetical protein